ncbi:MAG: HD-GYP domain-containing protein [candidate division Zixibacteria bacterium]|nr:HD-GYP domain-containing protein [candidate division Zixibacteria bacterium]
MIEDRLKQKLAEKLKDSRLKRVLGNELEELLAERPPDMPCGDFCAFILNLIGDQLKSELLDPETGEVKVPTDTTPQRTDAVGDFEFEYRKILDQVRNNFVGTSLQMLKALGGAIAERDTGNSDHNYRVTIYSVRFAEALSIDQARIRSIIKGSFLHDIGKISIADSALLKRSKLTEEEFSLMRHHPLMGARIIKDVRWLEDANDVVLYHHERWDGTGYLKGLKGESIPLNARLFCVADVFDALTSERPYKKALTAPEAAEMMQADRGAHFDPGVFDTFMSISPGLYDEVIARDRKQLDLLMTELMDTYFGVSPADEDIRSKFSDL